jgi:hypothetical protein
MNRNITNEKISILSSWLDRRNPLFSFIDLDQRPPNREIGGFLSLDVVVPVHESINLEAESLSDSWRSIHEYVEESMEIIRADEPTWLDSDEADMIKSRLGDPPQLSYPIYLITVGDHDSERLVYIGKTSSNSGRFKGGHAAITKLHHTKYNGLTKRIYLGAIVLLADDGSYQPLEWVKPMESALAVLGSIESQLIFEFKPELNSHHVHSYNAAWPVALHIQNFSGVTTFLHDKHCWSR